MSKFNVVVIFLLHEHHGSNSSNVIVHHDVVTDRRVPIAWLCWSYVRESLPEHHMLKHRNDFIAGPFLCNEGDTRGPDIARTRCKSKVLG